jgi:hypothetical protein
MRIATVSRSAKKANPEPGNIIAGPVTRIATRKMGKWHKKGALHQYGQRASMRYFLKSPGSRLRQAALPSVPGNLGMKRSQALSRYTQMTLYTIRCEPRKL